MTITRWKDPAGIIPDKVSIDLADGGDMEHRDAVFALLESKTPAARIERLRRHPELISDADKLATNCSLNAGSADWHLLALIANAEQRALYLDACPALVRDAARLAGSRKPRGCRMPRLDAWIRKKLEIKDYKNSELFGMIGDGLHLYIKDGCVVEDGKAPIGRSAFDRRVLAMKRKLGIRT